MAQKKTKKDKKKINWRGILDEMFNEKVKVDDKINVAVSMSVTVNIGNYESLRYGISASMDCKQSSADEVREKLENYIEKRLEEKYKKIKELTNATSIDVAESLKREIEETEPDTSVEEIELEEL